MQILVVVAIIQESEWALKGGVEKVSVWTAKAHGLDEPKSVTVDCVGKVGCVLGLVLNRVWLTDERECHVCLTSMTIPW